jgi:tyrosyl-DNA phosphodiesterase 2
MKKSKRYRAWRPDRICLKKNGNWKPKLIERIGMDPLPIYSKKMSEDFEIVTPSDHFGLYAEIEF